MSSVDELAQVHLVHLDATAHRIDGKSGPGIFELHVADDGDERGSNSSPTDPVFARQKEWVSS